MIRYLVGLCTLCMLVMTSGCAVPRNMHITYGLNPKRVDDAVRFRTTYYFRTFDYCWDANPTLKQFADATGGGAISYQKIIPQTDTLYRYRMTGKGSSLLNKIRFESGVLKAATIDPFGSQVTYSPDADGFYIRSNADVKNMAESAESGRLQRSAGLDATRSLAAEYLRIDPKETELRQAVLAKLVTAMEQYVAQPKGDDSEAQIKELTTAQQALTVSIGEIKAELAKLQAASAGEGGGDGEPLVETDKIDNAAKVNKAVGSVKKALSEAEASGKAVKAAVAELNKLGDCPVGEKIRKGFQIMGPEGLKTFDQDDRLVMAMSSSAAPLIETLNEYSGRILAARADPTSQLLGIAEETVRTETARRTVADGKAAGSDAAALVTAVIQAFAEDAK
jgi:cytochrome c556